MAVEPISPAEAAELIKLMKELRDITISDAKAFERLVGGAEDFRKELGSLRTEQKNLNSDINTFYEILKKSLVEVGNTSKGAKDTKKSFESLSSIASKLKYDQDGISTLTKKQLQTSLEKLEIERKSLVNSKGLNEDRLKAIESELKSKNISDKKRASLNSEKALLNDQIKTTTEFLKDQELGYENLKKAVKDRLKEEEKIVAQLGISGKIVDGIVGALGKLGISSTFFENLKEDMREVAKTGSKWDVLMTGVKGTVSGIGQALKDPVTQLTILLKIANFFFKAALNANAQAVELGKQLGYGTQRADAFREKMVAIESSSNNLNVTTANLTQAFGELVKATGFAYEFTADQLETQIKLTKQVGLQADEAAQIQRYSALSGKSSEETYKSFVKGLATARNQLRVGIDFRSSLAEAVKVSGQLAANLGYNPERIARAVVQAKALGTTLEDTKSQAESLLNFESSIENELKAELLTGQALNLERARALALQGDMAGVAQELANQGMTAAKFSKMNILAQNAYAQSLGTTSDKLAEQLRKREEAVKSGKSLQQISEEEAAQALERQNVQDKFNAAVEKLQSLFGNLMAGPLGSFLDMLSGGLNIINSMMTPLKIIGGLYLAHVATKKIALGYDIASKAANQISANLGFAQVGTNRAKLLLEKESLLTRLAGNVQLFNQLAAEHGVMSALKIQFGLQQATNAEKGKGFLITMKDWLYEKGKTIWQAVQKTGLVAINALKAAGSIIAKRDAMFTIAGAAMGALKAAVSGIGSLLGPFAVPIGIAAAAGVAALGYSLLKGDDVMSGGDGYGKRTLLAPEGAIRLNNKDTVIAGTNLGGGEGGGSGTNIDLSPVVSALAEVKAAIDQLINKEGVVMMDSVKIGTTQNMNGRYKTA
jgi:hypothetical protein